MLIQAGTDLDCKNSIGETALHIALANVHFGCRYNSNRRLPIVLMLYEAGAKPLLDMFGRTPVMRCHNHTQQRTALAKFCIEEFAKYEAAYYAYDLYEYKTLLKVIYNTNLRIWDKPFIDEKMRMHGFLQFPISFSEKCLAIQQTPKHLFSDLLRMSDVSVLKTTPNQIKKMLLIALESLNMPWVRQLLNDHSEIDINALMNEEGLRPISMVIHSSRDQDANCIPLLAHLN